MRNTMLIHFRQRTTLPTKLEKRGEVAGLLLGPPAGCGLGSRPPTAATCSGGPVPAPPPPDWPWPAGPAAGVAPLAPSALSSRHSESLIIPAAGGGDVGTLGHSPCALLATNC